jgi:hypothetical protein
MRVKAGLVLAFILLAVSCKSRKEGGEVYYIPTLHGMHHTNENYNFDSLKAIITKLNPDIIAVELRPEDVNADSVYLWKNYPDEMRLIRNWFPDVEIVGFDWLGHDIENMPIPDGYWDTTAFKVLDRQLWQDTLMKERLQRCRELTKERVKIMRSSSLKQLLESNDTELVVEFYACLDNVTKGTPYSEVPEFFKKRDEEILNNLNKLIAENKQKRIAIVTGDDHYSILRDSIAHKSLY